ncbi:MAG: hypothetical protein Q4D36_06440 [Bacteroidales bacterium]|mgnify:CR=1 FL=1|nr:hypothetical protein [Bacteroidales bacterium]
MAIGAITMILANVGLQIYNNWCGSRQNSELQKKREEFERAARDRNTEHMWKLLHEGQELTMQLEKEKYDDRLKELKEEVDHLLERLTYEATINNWPLKVLPIVMKNQAFGNLLANQEENVAMHVIFTRSNYDKFNKLVYPVVEKQLEQYCDKHWSTASNHPVLFYSGAWKPMSSPTDVQVSAIREELKNLPTLLIAPFFRPDDGKLVFQVHMWGVGPNSSDQFNIAEIEPKNDDFHFQRTYTNNQDYENEMGLLDEIVEDLVPYLQCMIGYMADTYFWSSAGLAPHLPLLVTNGTINTDGMKYLVDDSREYYDKLLKASSKGENVFSQENLLSLIEGSVKLWDKEDVKRTMLENTFLSMCSSSLGKEICSWDDLCSVTSSDNLKSLDFYDYIALKDLCQIRRLGIRINTKSQRIENLYHSMSRINREQFEIIDVDSFDMNQVYHLAKNRSKEAISSDYFIFITWNPNIIIGTFCTEEYKPCVFSKGHTARYLIVRCIKYVDSDNRRQLQSYSTGSKGIEDQWNRLYYAINLNNKKLLKMKEKSFEEQFGQSFERIGKGLGKIFDGMTSPDKNSAADQIWGNATTQETDSIDQILSYFIANAGKTIPAERVENMSMQNVLNWVDNNVTPFADKVYLIKGVNTEYKKHVFCVFFGAGEKVLLQDGSPRICFITSQYNEEMKQTFKENNICVIPLK